MKRLILKAFIVTFAWLMLAFSPLLANAQEAGGANASKLASEVITRTKVAETVAPILDQMLVMQFQQAAKQANDPAKAAVIMKMGAKIRERFKTRMPELMELNAALYAKYFTTSELQDLLNFYSTPTGAKLITSQGKLMGESVTMSQAWAKKFLAEETPKIVEEMKAEAGQKPM